MCDPIVVIAILSQPFHKGQRQVTVTITLNVHVTMIETMLVPDTNQHINNNLYKNRSNKNSHLLSQAGLILRFFFVRRPNWIYAMRFSISNHINCSEKSTKFRNEGKWSFKCQCRMWWIVIIKWKLRNELNYRRHLIIEDYLKFSTTTIFKCNLRQTTFDIELYSEKDDLW